MPIALSSRRREKLNHTLGSSPCGNCAVYYKHTKCRPRLDGTLCTCSCITAEMIRDEVERKTRKALSAGRQVPSIEEMVEILRPKYKPHFRN